MEKTMQLINELENTENRYEQMKLDLAEMKATLTLDTDWEKAIGKEKPTVPEKEAYVRKQTLPLEREIKKARVLRNKQRRIFEAMGWEE